jgi:S-DNA-T family DNA segregation ATPase FtsK/SpoIIIE
VITGRTPGTVLLGGTANDGVESVALSGAERFLAVIGETRSGRTTVLRTVVLQLQAQEVDLWVVDPRRSLLPVLGEPVRYAYAADDVTALLGDLSTRLAPRRPPAGLGPTELVARLRQRPAERPAVLVIDDYDLLGSAGLTGPLGPVAELLPYGDDVGLSVVVARGGSGRLGFDAGWQTLIDAGATGLLLSGEPTNGPAFGSVRPQHRAPGRGLLLRRSAAPCLVQVALPGSSAVADLRPRAEPQRLRTA